MDAYSKILQRTGGDMAIFSEVLEGAIERSYKAFVKPGDATIDMGVSVGRHLFPMADVVTETGKVFGFEAINSRYAIMLLEQAKRRLPQISLFNVALSDSEGASNFHIVHQDTGYSGLVLRKDLSPEARSTVETQQVYRARLDDLLLEHSRPITFIKADIEGAEFHAFAGGRKLLEKHRPILIFENGRQAFADLYGYSQEEFFRFFNEMDYGLYELNGQAFGREAWSIPIPNWHYFAVPIEKAVQAEMLTDFLPQSAEAVLGH